MTIQSWKLGKSIGVGGFGEIYLCTETTDGSKGRAASASFDDSAPLAVKIEPGRVRSSVHSLSLLLLTVFRKVLQIQCIYWVTIVV